MKANDIQHGGTHYGTDVVQHWDFAWQFRYNQFEYSATKYVERCWKKAGVLDLEKARHHLAKYIEVGVDVGKDRMAEPALLYLRTKGCDGQQILIFTLIHLGKIPEAVETLDRYIEQKAAEANTAYVDQG